MATFSRKHYEAVSAALEASGDVAAAVHLLADAFQQDNPNFDRKKFFAACGYFDRTLEPVQS
jgi:hypothetical protein